MTFCPPSNSHAFGNEPAIFGPSEARRILLVDDEPLLLRSLTVALARHGYSVCPMRRATSAIRVLEEDGFKPSAIVTDLRMPEMGGRAFAARARMLSTAPIILYSSAPMFDDPLFDYCIEKPATLPELLTVLDCALASSARGDRARD